MLILIVFFLIIHYILFKGRKWVKAYKIVGLLFHKNSQLGIMNFSCNLAANLPWKSHWSDYLPNKTPSLVLETHGNKLVDKRQWSYNLDLDLKILPQTLNSS